MPYLPPLLLAAFREEPVSLRKMAIVAAAHLSTARPEAWDILEKAAQDSLPTIRETAANALQEFSLQNVPQERRQDFSSRIARLLFALAQDPDQKVKATALQALSNCGIVFSSQEQERFFSSTIKAISEDSPYLTHAMVPILAKFFAIKTLSAPSLLSRKTAKTDFHWIWRWKGDLYRNQHSLPALCTRFDRIQPTIEQQEKAWQTFEMFAQNESPLIRREMLWVFWQFVYDLPSPKQEKFHELLQKASQDREETIRLTAIWMAGETFLSSPRRWQTMSWNIFQRALTDSSPLVRRITIWCIRRLLQDRNNQPKRPDHNLFFSYLLPLLIESSQQNDPEVKQLTVSALGKIPYNDLGDYEEKTWTILSDSLNNKNLSFKMETVYSIGTLLSQLPSHSPWQKKAWDMLYSLESQKDALSCMASNFTWISDYGQWIQYLEYQKKIFLLFEKLIEHSTQPKNVPLDISLSPASKLPFPLIRFILGRRFTYSLSHKFALCFPRQCSHPVISFMRRYTPWERFAPGASIMKDIPSSDSTVENLFLFLCVHEEAQRTIARNLLYQWKE